MKPLFKDVKAYDPEQDKDKGLLTKIFEKTIDVASTVLKNDRGEVATKAEVAGPVENPQASTWEMVATLFSNALFDALLPGLEGRGSWHGHNTWTWVKEFFWRLESLLCKSHKALTPSRA